MHERRTVGGRTVAWREAGGGAPALLLHCALAHSGAFGGVMARLGDGLAMRALDQPGHGGTDFDPALDQQDQAVANALALLDDRPPAHLVGHSFGGTVALRLAVEAPEWVASLTLIEPVYFSLLAEGDPAAYAAELAAQGPVRAAVGRADWPAAAEAFLGRWGTAGGFKGLHPRQAAYILERMPFIAGAEPAIQEPATARLHVRDLAGLACPVLLVEGGASPPSVAAILDVIAARIPRARRVAVPGAGHMLPVTHAEEVSGALRDFLAPEHAE
jgi:pimeloyl-ACP methyl ester carboxylesterase